jgi:hypothetical protein
MQYVRVSKSSIFATWLKRASALSTAPAKPYPIFEERIDYGQERDTLSALQVHQISSTRAWGTTQSD